MPDTGIYCTNAEIIARAGSKASSVSKAVAWTDALCPSIEASINVLCRRVFAVDAAAFTALPTSTKKILSDTAACMAAIYVIQYDLSKWTDRVAAEDMINLLRDTYQRNLAILKEKEHQTFLLTGVST